MMFTTNNATSSIAAMVTVRSGRTVATSVRSVQNRSRQLLMRRSRLAQRLPPRVLRERGFAVRGLTLGDFSVRGGTNERPFSYCRPASNAQRGRAKPIDHVGPIGHGKLRACPWASLARTDPL